MTVLGVGLDLVGLAAFEAQLADRASGFVAATFTRAELADAERGPGPRGERLAARFAAKEAFVKAWGAARVGLVPALDPAALDLREVEIVLDSFGRPTVRLHGAVAAAIDHLVRSRAMGPLDIVASLTHDPPVAGAVVVLGCHGSEPGPT